MCLLRKLSSDKSCYHDEFRCANRRCIAKSLECDGFNNCGDHSDECPVNIPSQFTAVSIKYEFIITEIDKIVYLTVLS